MIVTFGITPRTVGFVRTWGSFALGVGLGLSVLVDGGYEHPYSCGLLISTVRIALCACIAKKIGRRRGQGEPDGCIATRRNHPQRHRPVSGPLAPAARNRRAIRDLRPAGTQRQRAPRRGMQGGIGWIALAFCQGAPLSARKRNLRTRS